MLGVLDVQRDHARLVSRCHDLIAEGGELFFSTNLRSFEIDAGPETRLRLRETTRQTIPENSRRPGRPQPHRAWRAKKVTWFPSKTAFPKEAFHDHRLPGARLRT